MKSIFIILNFNSEKITKELAIKISKMNCIYKVIVVDNCSTDNSYSELMKIKNEQIDVIRSEKNGGYSYGNNFGVKYAKKYTPDIIFISNPDVDIKESEIIKIIKAFNKKEYALLSAVEYDINDNISIPAIWKRSTYKDDLLDCLYIARKLQQKKILEVDYDCEIQDVDIVKGSFLAIKYSDFENIHGFDENVFLFCEERIIAKKICDIGKKIGLITNAKYNHNHTASINKTYKFRFKQIKILYKSRMYYNKIYNKINLFKLLILKLFMSISIMEYFIVDIFNWIKLKWREKWKFHSKD